MKKIFVAAMAALFATTVNAQKFPDAKTQDAVKYNYVHEMKRKGPHQDEIKKLLGNDQEPTNLYTVDNHGWYIGAFGEGNFFANNTSLGGGFEVGYEGRKYGLGIHTAFRRVYEDDESDRKAKFNQGKVGLRLYIDLLHFANHHGKIRPFVEASFQLSSFYDEESSAWSGEYTDENGTKTSKTMSLGKLDNSQFTLGGMVGIEASWNFAFSPWTIFGGGGFGGQQNIILNTNKWYSQGEVFIGVRYRIARHPSYNREAMQAYNLSEADVWAMRPYQTPYNK